MANFDILTFLEYYSDKSNVLDSNGKRQPTLAYQNFYQTEQLLTADSEVNQSKQFNYLAFDASGFSSTEASGINKLTVNIAATADIIDLTDTIITGDILVIASLYIQSIGQENISNSANLICRYIGTIDNISINETTVKWIVTPAISRKKAQIPSKKISSDLMGRFITI
jgi:hypothetical protein|tara:strand:- start:3378 stop:3884 length:507 start_codon:yes stop_codon:yes gene_type:complete